MLVALILLSCIQIANSSDDGGISDGPGGGESVDHIEEGGGERVVAEIPGVGPSQPADGWKDCYAVLGLERDADDYAVREKYKAYALQFHPDKHMNSEDQLRKSELFKLARIARDVLLNRNGERESYHGECAIGQNPNAVANALFEATIFEQPPWSVETILKTHQGSQLWASVDDKGCKRNVRIVSSLKIEDFCDCEAYHNEKVMEKGLCPDLHLYIKKMLKELLKGEEGEEEETNFDKMEHRFVFVARPSPLRHEAEKEEEDRLTTKVEDVLKLILEQKKVPYYNTINYQQEGEDKEDIQRKIARVIQHKVPVRVLSIKQGAAPRGFVGHEYGLHDRDGIKFPEPRYPQVLCYIKEQDTGNLFLHRVWSPPSKEQTDKRQERKSEQLQAYLERVCGIMDWRKPEFRISPSYVTSILPKALLVESVAPATVAGS